MSTVVIKLESGQHPVHITVGQSATHYDLDEVGKEISFNMEQGARLTLDRLDDTLPEEKQKAKAAKVGQVSQVEHKEEHKEEHRLGEQKVPEHKPAEHKAPEYNPNQKR